MFVERENVALRSSGKDYVMMRNFLRKNLSQLSCSPFENNLLEFVRRTTKKRSPLILRCVQGLRFLKELLKKLLLSYCSPLRKKLSGIFKILCIRKNCQEMRVCAHTPFQPLQTTFVTKHQSLDKTINTF